LLSLHGEWGLAGWQWLFLMEGLPAILLSVVVFFCLADTPAKARWLTPEERVSIQTRLEADRVALGGAEHHGLLRALLDPRVLLLGFCNLCIMFSGYAITLSAPAVLQAATLWSTTKIGFTMALIAVLGTLTMLFNGWHADHQRERHLHTFVPLAALAVACVVIGTSSVAWIAVLAYGVIFTGQTALQATFWLIPTDVLHGRSAAIGVAAIGSIGMVGGFIGPYAMGLARDYTGSYSAGLVAVALPYATAAVILLVMRQRHLVNRTTLLAAALVS